MGVLREGKRGGGVEGWEKGVRNMDTDTDANAVGRRCEEGEGSGAEEMFT